MRVHLLRHVWFLLPFFVVQAAHAEIQIEQIIGPEFPGKYKHPAAIEEVGNGDLYLAYYGGDGAEEQDPPTLLHAPDGTGLPFVSQSTILLGCKSGIAIPVGVRIYSSPSPATLEDTLPSQDRTKPCLLSCVYVSHT